jgi:hypothetical protein
MSGDPTNIKHYMNFPVCGFCNTAWDVLYGRIRSATSPAQWVGYCKAGGCDPDIWDFIDEGTGWPNGWKLGFKGMPLFYGDPKKNKVKFPPTDNRVYHRRATDDQNAPWRKFMVRLNNLSIKESEKRRNVSFDDLEWEGADDPLDDIEDEDLFGPHGDDVVQQAQAGVLTKKKPAKKAAPASWADDDDLW